MDVLPCSATRAAVATDDLGGGWRLLHEPTAPRQSRAPTTRFPLRRLTVAGAFLNSIEQKRKGWAWGAAPPGGEVSFFVNGDVAQTSVDFHRLSIGPPQTAAAFPRVRYEGLVIKWRPSSYPWR